MILNDEIGGTIFGLVLMIGIALVPLSLRDPSKNPNKKLKKVLADFKKHEAEFEQIMANN